MTNWPNIQEYRNFEAKFFDNSKHNYDSAAESEIETIVKDEYKNDKLEDTVNGTKLHNVESKTVRCVIRKDFEEAFKKLDRGDGLAVNYESVRPKTQDASGLDQTVANKVRIQNHLKWKKQKEEEYLQKKEAERIAQQKKKEEDLRLESLKKQREKEREEKIKVWQEQKAREKEERKKEKMVMKALEKELKTVTPAVDKEKLIEEWVKLKNKQKQMEAEKKAELLKKEEESREVRQNLAKLSYMQWKERIKGRMMTLPKNGYQIFGPKPVPVVKEDWNHDFIKNSPRNEGITLRNIKSSTNTSLTFRAPIKELENLSKDIFYLNDFKNRSPNFYRLKAAKSGLNLCNLSENFKEQNEMPLKELQPGTIELKENWGKNTRSCYELKKFYNSHECLINKPKTSSNVDKNSIGSNLLSYDDYYPSNYLYSAEENQNVMQPLLKNSSRLYNDALNTPVLPNTKKIELYINPYSKNSEIEEGGEKLKKKVTNKTWDVKGQKEIKKETTTKEVKKNSSFLKEKTSIQKSKVDLKNDVKQVKNVSSESKKIVSPDSMKGKLCRRSRSYDKPTKKLVKDREKANGCSSSRSMLKKPRLSGEPCNLRLSKSKGFCCQKRKTRRSSKPNTPESASKKDKKVTESEIKMKKKIKKKNASISKSFTCSDSPYCVKRTSSKSLGKPKGNCRKNGETKSERMSQCRKLSTTKI